MDKTSHRQVEAGLKTTYIRYGLYAVTGVQSIVNSAAGQLVLLADNHLWLSLLVGQGRSQLSVTFHTEHPTNMHHAQIIHQWDEASQCFKVQWCRTVTLKRVQRHPVLKSWTVWQNAILCQHVQELQTFKKQSVFLATLYIDTHHYKTNTQHWQKDSSVTIRRN